MISIEDFDYLKRRSLALGVLFRDPDFQASNKVLRPSSKAVRWLRPTEICRNPKFEVEGFSRFDVRQGELGDCWLLAALANLTENKSLFRNVVPYQSFKEDYAGIFCFHFWRSGQWIPVVIDDLLPTFNGKLLYMKAPNDEFWPALLEKAYAKFYGSYAAIEGGNISEAMVDFTGGIIERYQLDAVPNNFFNIMRKAHVRGSLIGAAIWRGKNGRSKGLIDGHAYSVTKVVEVNASNNKKTVRIVRVKNPWSNDCEWNGPFSDRSSEWDQISDSEKREIQVKFQEDGEFFMTFGDFLANFSSVEMCHVSPDVLEDVDQCKQYEVSTYKGRWRGAAESPQIIVNLLDPDEEDDDDYCTIVVSLMQENRRIFNKQNNPISFKIYKLTRNDAQRNFIDKKWFDKNSAIASEDFQPYREICGRFRFLPGYYMILPSCSSSDAGEFLLRTFTEAVPGKSRQGIILKVNECNDGLRIEKEKKLDPRLIMTRLPENFTAVPRFEKTSHSQRGRPSRRKKNFCGIACRVLIGTILSVLLSVGAVYGLIKLGVLHVDFGNVFKKEITKIP